MSEELDPVLRLVEQIQAGINPEDNFSKIFSLYYRQVLMFFDRKGFPSEESRDLAQETFFQVYRALGSFRAESRFERWLFEVTNRIYWNELRRRKSDKRDGVEVSIDESGYEGGPSLVLMAENEDLVAGLIWREQSQALRAALQELPEQMRQCCIFRYEKGYKYQEIASLMGISIETVKAHLHQARKRLIVKLGDAGTS